MKTVVFIDGENFIYQLRDTLAKQRLIKYRDELSRVDIRSLLANTLQDPKVKQAKINYYASKIHIIDRTPELKERTERYAADSEVWQKVLASQRVDYVEAGHLLVRDGKPCVECGHREPVLVEKGVDVTIATDLIRASGENVRLVLLSSDGDLMPAVEESKRRGSELAYVGFRGVSNAALARAATTRYTITGKIAAGVLAPKPKPDPDAPGPEKPEQEKTARQAVTKPDAKPSATQAEAKSDEGRPHRSRGSRGRGRGRGHSHSHSHEAKPADSQPGAFTGSRLASILPSLPPKKTEKAISKTTAPKPAIKRAPKKTES